MRVHTSHTQWCPGPAIVSHPDLIVTFPVASSFISSLQ